ncbi:MAG: homoserine O-succinyltransferase [Christensenellaceae bacterium]|jgi:homoserine O-succinyltransferase|nr:homoserine O-succinyltransferase [Christensenellaceae bacterium]
MPIIIPEALPAFKILSEENIFIMSKQRAASQDIRPIEVAILNLMPTKIETETQFMRLLSNTPLQVNITLIQTATYQSKNISFEHMEKFYKRFDEIKNQCFDGLIITGAPVENMDFESVDYWSELKEILDYARSSVTSMVFVCWGAQAALYHYFGINKIKLEKKLFGVFKNKAISRHDLLLKGFDDTFYVPHSRHTSIDERALRANVDIQVLASGQASGISVAKTVDNRMFFFFGHTEYDKDTLKNEYMRDCEKGIEIARPVGYFRDGGNDKIVMNWRSTGNLLFYNWLNYYVYQVTPYHLGERK